MAQKTASGVGGSTSRRGRYQDARAPGATEGSRGNVISVRGARVHNLKNIDVEIPRDKLVVICGLSGSGKSSLAFDTVFAEGQRRYVESLSAYARQFLGQMDKPDVDHIDGLSPAIAIDQKSTNANPRSTVGTVTEIHDYLRLLYARVGEPRCAACNGAVGGGGIDSTVRSVLDAVGGRSVEVLVLAVLVEGRKGTHAELITQQEAAGFARVRLNGEVMRISEAPALDKNRKHTVETVIDRFTMEAKRVSRLRDALSTGLSTGAGRLVVEIGSGEDRLSVACSPGHTCTACGRGWPELEPRSFSFNSPYGACPSCDGIGHTFEAAEDLVVPDPGRALRDGAIAPFAAMMWVAGYERHALAAMCRAERIPFDKPWSTLTRKQRTCVLKGTGSTYESQGYTLRWRGVESFVLGRHRDAESDQRREQMEQYLREVPCPDCGGDRLNAYALAATVAGRSIGSMNRESIENLAAWFSGLALEGNRATIAKRIVKEINERLGFLVDVGLGYLNLGRAAKTLSGGEAQRIRLASQVGSGLQGVLYVLDEPSIGLHQRDNDRLIATLCRLRDLGNTVLVVEHDEDTIAAADWVIDVGPGAGEHGGEIVACGTLLEIKACERSRTGDFLSGRDRIEIRPERRSPTGWVTILGAEENNLRSVDAAIPLGVLSVVCGVSGSGKSSLITQTLQPVLTNALNKTARRVGRHRKVVGLEQLDKAIVIDQSPIGRTPRSNPATYTGAFDKIRALFSELPVSKERGWKPGRFSFNVPVGNGGGRCESCDGDGVLKVEMHFLPDVYVRCEACGGRRFRAETLEATFKGYSIADVLEMSIERAAKLFEHQRPIARVLETLCDVGLGYLSVGHSATLLSGGEAQRVKLASELCKRATGKTVYLLDEPTVGLHMADVKILMAVLQRLVDGGNTVVVVEHNLDVIKCADWVIEMGPEGGAAGGVIVACGTPELVAAGDTHTAAYLSRALRPKRRGQGPATKRRSGQQDRRAGRTR